uniref:SPX domain-containing protein n=1 Tax=Kalanchoe fedtschenkoi TaxID=63787 RepID=A0A7N0TD16_KALFE
MKFGKSLSVQIEETLPEWRDKFLKYKELKKRLKLVEPVGEDRPSKRSRIDSGGGTREEIEFIMMLEDEMEKFNGFFMEKEEEYIIRLKDLKDRVAESKDDCKEMISIRKEIVDFHGEMVLLENYSALNYTGMGKILKKYDKRTGALIRLPFIQKVLEQPFCNTVLLYKLVKECEAMLDQLFPVNQQQPTANETETAKGEDKDDENPPSTSGITKTDPLLTDPKELAKIKHMQSLHMKSAISALRVLKDIRKGSSTVSIFSLPPLQTGGLDEAWKKPSPIMEEVAE